MITMRGCHNGKVKGHKQAVEAQRKSTRKGSGKITVHGMDTKQVEIGDS